MSYKVAGVGAQFFKSTDLPVSANDRKFKILDRVRITSGHLIDAYARVEYVYTDTVNQSYSIMVDGCKTPLWFLETQLEAADE